jgi:hypothetical protein
LSNVEQCLRPVGALIAALVDLFGLGEEFDQLGRVIVDWLGEDDE